MKIVIHLDPARLFRWHLELASFLQHAGHEVRVNYPIESEPLPLAVSALLDIDAARAHTSVARLSDRMRPDDLQSLSKWDGADEPDLAVVLTTPMPDRIARTLRPAYDGVTDEEALFASLISGRAPFLSVIDTAHPQIWRIGLPAFERPGALTTGMDQITSRLTEGLLRIVRDIEAGSSPADGEEMRHEPVRSGISLAAAARTMLHRGAAKIGDGVQKLLGRDARWHVAWRPVDASHATLPSELDIAQFSVLADDRQRYYADPFAIERDGRIHVFVEELPAETGVGVISHFMLDGGLRASAPRVVLETQTHLSYPFLFEHQGELWMMPEASASGGLDIYRCQRFPDDWRHETRILEGRFHDATMFQHGDLYWIAAATEAFQSSCWDALSLFYASSPFGPWRPHARNPVLVDARFARPAGPLIRTGEQMVRPAQNCREGYGYGTTLRRLTELTPDSFAEETIGALHFGAHSRIKGPHSLCRAGGIEFIDVYCRDQDLPSGLG